jgi:hypothetical protein
VPELYALPPGTRKTCKSQPGQNPTRFKLMWPFAATASYDMMTGYVNKITRRWFLSVLFA